VTGAMPMTPSRASPRILLRQRHDAGGWRSGYPRACCSKPEPIAKRTDLKRRSPLRRPARSGPPRPRAVEGRRS
jgi:hypothetical protein